MMTIGQNMSRFATSKIRESPGGAGTDPLICPRPLGPDLLQSRPRPASCQLTNNGCIDNSQNSSVSELVAVCWSSSIS